MFYAHFVLTKKGPLARIWLAAHWDKKLTKAHVFETNIDHSVEAILEPKVKLALRTSGHLMLGVVRIYSRKAKYLLSDCNEAFVKIKMAFRPGVVDLPEENREAAVAAITLQENFHDFDSFADLSDIDVHVNQSRPEEITMREDLGNIQLVGDDGFGDVFDDREMARDASTLDSTLYKSPHHDQLFEKSKCIDLPVDQPMDIDLNAPVTDDGFGAGLDDGAFIAGGHDDDSSDDDNFGGDVDQEFFGDNFIDTGGLFEEPTTSVAPMVTEPVDVPDPVAGPSTEDTELGAETESGMPPEAGAAQAEQTTLVPNEEEAFALEPIDVTAYPGTDRPARKRKRKLVVDESKGIQSETMKMQLSDTTEIITTLDLAPPTKKLMHWKETGGVDKLFALSARADRSRPTRRLFSRNLVTKPVDNVADFDLHLQPDVTLEAPELARDEKHLLATEDQRLQDDVSRVDITAQPDAVPPTPDVSRQSLTLEKTLPDEIQQSDIFGTSNLGTSLVDVPPDPVLDTRYLDDEPPSIAPFSIAPPSMAPPSVAPLSVPPMFEDLEEVGEAMPENEEQEEKRLTKRSHQMQHALSRAFRQQDTVQFFELTRGHYRKQMAAKFYTLLVLKKAQTISVHQEVSFGDIALSKGTSFHEIC